MGDRATVYVHEGDQPGVYLYTHWEGYELPDTVRIALARGRDRWNDMPYLARIIFDQMVGDQQMETTGFGIMAGPIADGRNMDVDTARQEVRVGDRRVDFRVYVEGGPTTWAG